MLKGTTRPHDKVWPLGTAPAHGPSRETHLVVILGVGPGLGLAIARTFAAQGYRTAILSRSKDRLDAWAQELDQVARSAYDAPPSGPLSLAFACDMHNLESISTAFRDIQAAWPEQFIGTAVYNGSVRIRGPFLKSTMQQLQESIDGSIYAFYTFAQHALRAMETHGQGGSLLVTGASASLRGRVGFPLFGAAKGALRNMTMSLAKEFGPKNIHVAHVIVDGLIESKIAQDKLGLKDGERFPDGTTWLFLAQQHPSTWTFELDLRPAHEHF
ncbi:hypothetical protein MCUN1_002844 [Malassezia cuniculi]|uniref:NAD(P)-binding protein n=1 Tax=Malassezia cuniculi TaxID=948313 RepID=A0AAF0ES53_9BASI|nr:hypothetical protein MCUN1_002844 [Malassezia cuniculi]